MTIQLKKLFKTLSFLTLLIVIGSFLSLSLLKQDKSTNALDSDFSNGITVDSTLDAPDDSITNGPGPDGTCDDGDGNCTLRAAIEEANSDPDTSTINFDIQGTPDFTNNSQDGYTISPTSELPAITEQVTIDGYSQPGAQANTAVAPNPLNGRLLIEIDGVNVGNNLDGLVIRTDDSTIRGLAINGFDRVGVVLDGSDVSIVGNYIGADPAGLTANPNGGAGVQGFEGSGDASSNVKIGGLNAGDRNLISGNAGSAITPNQGHSNWTIQGNYIGTDVTGLTALPNNTVTPAGTLSLDNDNGHVLGGPQLTAINVISGNGSMGIAPNNTDNTLIEGNYIGVGYDGVTPLGNSASGISYSGGNTNLTIRNNIINYNFGGIYINDAQGVNIEGNEIMHNGITGVMMEDSDNIVVGGNTEEKRNVISDNNTDNYPNMSNLSFSGFPGGSWPFGNLTIQGNYIGTDKDGQVNPSFDNIGAGVGITTAVENTLIGGIQSGEGNIIAGNNGPGVMVEEVYIPDAGPLTISPENISILGNSIHSNSVGDVEGGLGQSGLGIDLFRVVLDGTFTPESVEQTGPTPNDNGDTDTGPNNYINFPVLNSVSVAGGEASINFNLDAADSPTDQYRVEFFANDSADPSGYGEGQTFLGSTTVSNGNNQVATLTLPSGTNLTGKSISATTTAIDNTTDSGFGGTSEFSAVVSASVAGDGSGGSTNGSGSDLAGTGDSTFGYLILSLSLVVLPISIYFSRLRFERY